MNAERKALRRLNEKSVAIPIVKANKFQMEKTLTRVSIRKGTLPMGMNGNIVLALGNEANPKVVEIPKSQKAIPRKAETTTPRD